MGANVATESTAEAQRCLLYVPCTVVNR